MHRAKQQSSLRQPLLVVAIVCMIALVLMLSFALASAAGHSFDHVSLALPVFFLLLLLTLSAGERLPTKSLAVLPKVSASPAPSRAPPAPLS